MTIAQFYRLIRPRTLTASFSPVILGAAYGGVMHTHVHSASQSLFYTLLVFICVLTAQMAANIWNEYFDFKSGLDLNQVIGNSGSIVREGLSPAGIKRLGYVFTIIPLIIGVALSAMITWWFIPAGLICMAIMVCYSGGPKPLSRTPFGELASGIAMGFAIVLITAYTWTGQLTWDLLIPAIPSTILIGAIMMTNNLRDFANDKAHGRRTLVILMGHEGGTKLLGGLFAFTIAWTAFFAFTNKVPLVVLISSISFITAMKGVRILQSQENTVTMDKAMKFSALSTTLYHVLFTVGLLWSYWGDKIL